MTGRAEIDPYAVLGLPPTASQDEIRAAYRRLARRHHPDTAGGGPDAARRMAEVNAAWRILGDSQRRRDHDVRVASSVSSAATVASERAPAPRAAPEPRRNPFARYQDPPRVPWRPMLVVAALGTALVVVNSAMSSPAPAPPVDNLLAPGACVVIETNGDAREVICDGGHDGVVERLVDDPLACPQQTEPHRDRQGLGIACVDAG